MLISRNIFQSDSVISFIVTRSSAEPPRWLKFPEFWPELASCFLMILFLCEELTFRKQDPSKRKQFRCMLVDRFDLQRKFECCSTFKNQAVGTSIGRNLRGLML